MQTIFITGVSDGIGHALAVHQAAAGRRVLGLGRRPFPPSLAGAMQPEDYCRTDLARGDAAATVRDFLDERGVHRLDVLVHNAALGWYGPPAAQSPASIDELLAVNLRAPIALTHMLLPRLVAAHGVVALVSSVHAALPTPDFAVYTATKAALDGFARNLRLEYRDQVDVIVVWPGATRTEMHARSGVPAARAKAARYRTPEAVAAQMARAINRRRSGALGAANGLLRWLSVHFEPLVEGALVATRGRRNP
jgi:short-subunit dehydrogenase